MMLLANYRFDNILGLLLFIWCQFGVDSSMNGRDLKIVKSKVLMGGVLGMVGEMGMDRDLLSAR